MDTQLYCIYKFDKTIVFKWLLFKYYKHKVYKIIYRTCYHDYAGFLFSYLNTCRWIEQFVKIADSKICNIDIEIGLSWFCS